MDYFLKTRILFVVCLINTLNSFGQLKIDNSISIDINMDSVLIDTVKYTTNHIIFNLTYNKNTYIVQKIANFQNKKDSINLPNDKGQLMGTYKDFLYGSSLRMKENRYELVESSEVPFENFIAMKSKYTHIGSHNPIVESVVLFLDGYFYQFVRIGDDKPELSSIDFIIQKLKINYENNPKQISNNNNFFQGRFLFYFILVLLIAGAFLIIRKNDWFRQ